MYQKLFIEDKTYVQVAKEIGRSRSVIQNWAQKMGLARGEKWERIKKIHGEKIVEMYTGERKTLLEISDIIQCHYSTIRKILEESEVRIRSLSESKQLRDESYIYRKYDLNEEYFKTWSSNMAYILGFIAADGCIHTNIYKSDGGDKKKHSLVINLQEGDKEHLEKIAKELEYEGKVHIYPSAGYRRKKDLNYSALSINSKTMIEDIKRIGIKERKSLDKEVPKSLPEEYEIDYIRGYFDGNGSVGMQYPTNSRGARSKTAQIRVRIYSGSKDNLEQMQKILTRYSIKKKKVASSSNIFEICYSTKESLMLYDLFYSSKSSMRLDRKYDSFTRYIGQRESDVGNSKGFIKVSTTQIEDEMEND